ncbi:MAG TPA: HD domain-containing protein [Candidatus Dormibacteraeota bacterium]
MSDLARHYDAVNLVADPLHGYIKITKHEHGSSAAAEQDLLDDPWLQRLRRIHQLQSAWWVFPGGEHSRFQHALGAMHLSGEWARRLDANLRQLYPDAPSSACVEETLRVAGLLHDVGHGPFGHFFDQNYLDRFGIDHEVIGRALIQGELAPAIGGLDASPHGRFEPGERIDPRWVAELIAEVPLPGGEAPDWVTALKPVLNGMYTADNLDYVPRDAYMCGVKVGPVDIERLLHYSFLDRQGMLLHQHGAQALLLFLNARLYLYNNIYYHRTVRRIDLHMREIFRETIERILSGNPLQHPLDYLALTDWSLIETVDRWSHDTGRSAELAEEWARIVRRELKWRLIFEDYYEFSSFEDAVFYPQPAEYVRRIREALPASLRSASLEVDVASVDPRPQNPFNDPFPVNIYNPVSRAVERSAVAELFRRLPIRTTLVRVFSDESEQLEALRDAAERALYRPDSRLAEALS